LNELGAYAQDKNVKVAIEPITHWETPGPNTLAQLTSFLTMVPNKQIGVVVDSAHETLDGAGPEVFADQVASLAADGRLHYVQASSPDRGRLDECWLPWSSLLKPLLDSYEGPVAIEIFNAVPAFAAGLRLSRRKYWIPGLDCEAQGPSAYDVAKASYVRLVSELRGIEA